MNGGDPNYMILQGRSPSSILKTTMVMLVVEPTHLKNMSQTWVHLPQFSGWNYKTCSKPPPRWLFWWMLMFNRFTPRNVQRFDTLSFLVSRKHHPSLGGHHTHTHTHMLKKHVASISWTCLRCLEQVPNIVSQMVIYHGRIRVKRHLKQSTPRFAWFKSAFQRTKPTDQNSNLDVTLEVRING